VGTVSSQRRSRKLVRPSQTMTLYHVSPARNQDSIGRCGLLPERATGREKAVWMATKSMIWRAILHVARKHGRGSIIDRLIVYNAKSLATSSAGSRRGLGGAMRRSGRSPGFPPPPTP
jgi:hypothetical protein